MTRAERENWHPDRRTVSTLETIPNNSKLNGAEIITSVSDGGWTHEFISFASADETRNGL